MLVGVGVVGGVAVVLLLDLVVLALAVVVAVVVVVNIRGTRDALPETALVAGAPCQPLWKISATVFISVRFHPRMSTHSLHRRRVFDSAVLV